MEEFSYEDRTSHASNESEGCSLHLRILTYLQSRPLEGTEKSYGDNR